jgi:hypothetical protein
MSIYRLQVSWQFDTVAPRDAMVITPHFAIDGNVGSLDGLCKDMVDGLQAITPIPGEVRCKAYDAQGTPPVYPVGDYIVNKGLTHPHTYPRELALCLSFYSGRNVKRQRGRIYLPPRFLQVETDKTNPVTPIAKMDQVADLFEGLGGINVDWVVYSRLLDKAFPVTNYWYDNEWDVMRSRGRPANLRYTGTTAEASTAAVEQPLA